MEYIGNFTKTEQILKKYGFSIRKKYGQNFLIDPNILNKIVDTAEVGKDDIVLEVGPGLGTLTQYLASRARRVIAVEIDSHLIPILEETLADFPNAEVIHEDILKFDIDACFERIQKEEESSRNPESALSDGSTAEDCVENKEKCEKRMHFKVVANLPYYITTPVMMKLLTGMTAFDAMLFMVQKEVAERMCAAPGTKDYGALTLAASYYTDLKIAGTVPPSCFLPRPNVESALLYMKVWKEKQVSVKDEKLMFALIRGSFNQRRKTLVNGIAGFEGLPYTKDEVREALEAVGLPATVRGEALTLAQFAALADQLSLRSRQSGE